MLLSELFASDTGNLVDDMRALMIDVLTPLAANDVPYVSLQQVIDRLQEIRSGVRIDPNLVMTILDPNKVKIVDKIEGDRIYFSSPQADEVAKREEDEEAEKQKIQHKANTQAQKEVTAPSGGDDVAAVAGKARAALGAA